MSITDQLATALRACLPWVQVDDELLKLPEEAREALAAYDAQAGVAPHPAIAQLFVAYANGQAYGHTEWEEVDAAFRLAAEAYPEHWKAAEAKAEAKAEDE